MFTFNKKNSYFYGKILTHVTRKLNTLTKKNASMHIKKGNNERATDYQQKIENFHQENKDV